jgi:virginiamycin A acetyltransferase
LGYARQQRISVVGQIELFKVGYAIIMNFSEKLSLFKNQDALEAIELPLNVVSDSQINKIHAKNLVNCYFERNADMESPVISSSRSSFIGAYSYMNGGGYIKGNVFIGRYCSIGRRVSIGAGMHSIHGLSSSPIIRNGSASPYSPIERERLGIKNSKRYLTIVNSDVWIGDGVVIMPGVTIGTGAVIGANSVVTKDVPPYAVVGGGAAKIIKYRFPNDVVCDLLQTEWWDLTPEQLELLPTGNVFQFIDEIKNNREINRESFDTYKLASY